MRHFSGTGGTTFLSTKSLHTRTDRISFLIFASDIFKPRDAQEIKPRLRRQGRKRVMFPRKKRVALLSIFDAEIMNSSLRVMVMAWFYQKRRYLGPGVSRKALLE